MVLTSSTSATNAGLFKASGAGSRNCDGRVSTHGVIVANCGPAPLALSRGVGRHTPGTFAPRNGGGGGAFPSARRIFQMLSATVWPQAIPLAMEGAVSLRVASEALR